MFLDCEKARHICDKTQYKESTLLEKIKHTIHLIYCSACRKYSKSNVKLTKTVKKVKLKPMDSASKTKIETTFNNELSKQQQH